MAMLSRTAWSPVPISNSVDDDGCADAVSNSISLTKMLPYLLAAPTVTPEPPMPPPAVSVPPPLPPPQAENRETTPRSSIDIKQVGIFTFHPRPPVPDILPRNNRSQARQCTVLRP